jgi:hypothetical protein
MFRNFIFTIPMVLLSSVAQAQSFAAKSQVSVQPLAGGSFSTSASGKFGARGAWCAAADYALSVLGKSGTTRIYVQQPASTRSGPVVFGLDPAGASPASVFSTSAALRTPGSNLSIDHAIQFCADARLSNG